MNRQNRIQGPFRSPFGDFFGDFFGAFADAGILLPLIWVLASRIGFSLPWLLLTSGVLFLASGIWFRAPMPVQPLKSLVLTAAALGATLSEIRLATLGIGLFFCAGFCLNRYSGVRLFQERGFLDLPEPVIRSLQWGLGLLLLRQGFALLPDSGPAMLIAGTGALCLFLLGRRSSGPWLGIFAFAVFCAGFLGPGPAAPFAIPSPPGEFRMSVVLSLVLPQIALTWSNSILGTELAFREYFGPKAAPPVARPLRSRLLFSIGAGNLLMAASGGLPFCHGSGGLTAHYRAGARSALMNFVMGGALILLAATIGRSAPLALPPVPTGILLITVGIHHLGLARSLFSSLRGGFLLLGTTLVIAGTGNLFHALIAALILQIAGRIPRIRPGRALS